MKNRLYLITIISIIILVCSSCNITRQTACPTFANKTKKIHKPLFSKKTSSKKDKKPLAKSANQIKKNKTKNNNFAQIENILSKIEIQNLTVSSDNEIALNPTNTSPSFIETKLQKIIYKKVEKKSKKILKTLDKHNQEKSAKTNDPTDEREVHDLAIVSLMAGITIYLTPLFFLLIAEFFLVLTILLIIFTIKSGNVAYKKITNNQSRYKGKKIANIGIALGEIAIGIIIAFLAFFFLFYRLL